MEAAASLLTSKVTLFSSSLFPARQFSISYSHFHKQFKCGNLSFHEGKVRVPPVSSTNCAALSVFSNSTLFSPLRSVKCSYSSSAAPTNSESPNPLFGILKRVPLESLKSTLLQLTPVDICKWCLAFSVVVAASKWVVNVAFNPFVWMYFSWTWLFWPWIVAIALAISGCCSLSKYLKGEASLFDQVAIVTSSITWLTLVPPARFNGFLQGWPFVFFVVYHYFFFLNVSVRKRLYGDFYPREHDSKWDISLPNWQKILFCAGVMVGHWLAAFEGVELHLIPGGWNNVAIWAVILMTVYMQYHSTLYLANYSEKVVVPSAVVQFGPYRFVRHPIYASTMLLFVTYFAALRSPLSALFTVAVCLMYYGQKAKLEEALMLETFGERYSEYMSKVKYKLIPFVY